MNATATFLLLTLFGGSALGQTLEPQSPAQTVKQALITPGGFNADWSCAKDTGGTDTGRSQLLFREEGASLVVDVNNFGRGTCKSEVAVADTGATWKGCRGTPVQMVFDSSSKDVPFTGTGGPCTYKFKAR